MATTYCVAGTVFLDANGNTLLAVDEPFFANTTVELYDSNGSLIGTMTTDANGAYNFCGLNSGDYSVAVLLATTDNSDFNETLAEYFTALHSTLNVTINDADVNDIDFPQTINMDDINDDLDPAGPDGDGYSFTGTGNDRFLEASAQRSH